ncbi:MAG: flavin reductase [Anaerolineae bacterium]|nr:flavin reductase [Anaerolineae bacterium]
MSKTEVQNALDQLTYGIYVVTVGLDGGATALTASWVSQVSFDPPLVMVALGRDRFCNRILREGKKFVINVLEQGQERLAGAFAKDETGDRLSEVSVLEPQTTGAPVLADALAYLDCQVADIYEAGDHTLFIGRVIGAGVLREGKPLSTAVSNLRYHGA